MFFSILSYFLFCSIFADLLIQWSFLNGDTPPSPLLTTFTLTSHVNALKEAKQPRFECKSALPPNVDRYAYPGGVCLLAGCDCTAQSVNLYLVSDTPVQTPRHTCHLIILANGGALTDLRRFKLKVLWEMKENLCWDFVLFLLPPSLLHPVGIPSPVWLCGCGNKARRDGGEIFARLVATYYFFLFPSSSRLVWLAAASDEISDALISMQMRTPSSVAVWTQRQFSATEPMNLCCNPS